MTTIGTFFAHLNDKFLCDDVVRLERKSRTFEPNLQT